MDFLEAYFIGSVLIALLMYLVKSRKLDYLLFIPFLGLQVYFTYRAWFSMNQVLDEYFSVDALSMIFLILNTVVAVPTVIHAFLSAERKHDSRRAVSIHNAALVLFIVAMTGVLISSHVGLLWAFAEATTLTSAALIYHDRNLVALEATWKYVFVASIGIAFAFLGILFLGIATQDAQSPDLSLAALAKSVNAMESTWLKMSFLFIVAGFSVKIGTVPLFTVEIDAKDAAPSAIGALFSGGLLNVGFVAIFRFYEVFSHTEIHAWMNKVLMITGLTSVFFAAVYLLSVKNFKRMFAYSSLEHAGLVLIAVSAGGVGYFAAIFHLIAHSLIKASLFFQIGQVQQTFRHKNVERTGNYLRINPWGGAALLVGFVGILALPPSGLFISEVLTFKALITGDHWMVMGMLAFLLTFILYGMGNSLLQVLFKPLPAEELASIERISAWESVPEWILLLGALTLGLYPPPALNNLIQIAVAHLPNVVKL